MVTGGIGATSSVRTSVELLSSNGTRLCSLPNLTVQRYHHSQTGLLSCGGGNDQGKKSCITFTAGSWQQTHTLAQRREGHTAWASPRGVLLITGGDPLAGTTTELLTDDGRTTPSFALPTHLS